MYLVPTFHLNKYNNTHVTTLCIFAKKRRPYLCADCLIPVSMADGPRMACKAQTRSLAICWIESVDDDDRSHTL